MKKYKDTSFETLAGFKADKIRALHADIKALEKQINLLYHKFYISQVPGYYQLCKMKEVARAVHLVQGFYRGRKFTDVERYRYLKVNQYSDEYKSNPNHYGLHNHNYFKQKWAIEKAFKMIEPEDRKKFEAWCQECLPSKKEFNLL